MEAKFIVFKADEDMILAQLDDDLFLGHLEKWVIESVAKIEPKSEVDEIVARAIERVLNLRIPTDGISGTIVRRGSY